MRRIACGLVSLAIAFPCWGETFIVDPDGLGDFTKIQDAINYSWHGDTIIVNQGVYLENINFNGRGIILTSSDPNDINIIETTIIQPTNEPGVIFEWGEGYNSILRGLTIREKGILCNSSSPSIEKNIITNCSGTALSGSNNSLPTIRYNIIKDNTYGIGSCGGLIENNEITNNVIGILSCHGLIESNLISYNTSRGLSVCNGTISQNEIVNNTSKGISGGAGLRDCDGIIKNNIISNNRQTYGGSGEGGGGLYGCDGDIVNNVISYNYSYCSGGGLKFCNGTIKNNVISFNQSDSYGGGLCNCNAGIKNNVIVHNQASLYSGLGGGLYNCVGTIINNTIAWNQAWLGGGLGSCGEIIKNNIIAFNTAMNIVGGVLAYHNGSYNAFWMNQGGNFDNTSTPGIGDVIVDPLFADSTNGDYHLKSELGRYNPDADTWIFDNTTSHCIDAGDPSDTIGYESNPNGGRINMGAYGGTWEASCSTSGTGPEPPARCLEFPEMDFNKDCKVDLLDFSIFLQSWLECNLTPEDACGN